MSTPDGTSHHGSHIRLLRTPRALRPPARIDAIVVPTGRPVEQLDDALHLAARLDCQVVLLCSLMVTAEEATERAGAAGVSAISIDVHDGAEMPTWSTTELLADTIFEVTADTNLKRNIGLGLARMAGWSRILFLDDDIKVAHHDEVRSAVALLDRYDAVGIANKGFPDNSVVCYAYRETGGKQGSFIGGGALAVPADRTRSFFPHVYNDDWLFLLAESGLSSVAVTGSMEQLEYDPYSSPDRARAQEFGDCLAEGVYALLDDHRSVRDANVQFWRRFLRGRKQLIEGVCAKIPGLPVPEEKKTNMLTALGAALKCHRYISAEMCGAYLKKWRQDRKTWRRFLDGLPRGQDPIDALKRLGLQAYATGLGR